jgi:cyanophycinase
MSKLSLVFIAAFYVCAVSGAHVVFVPNTENITGNGWKAYCEGNCTPVGSATRAPVYGGSIFMGGGDDVTAAFKQQIAWLAGGDFVVLRSDDDNGYNDWIYTTLGGVRSVTSLIVFSRDAANDAQVVSILSAADAIFVAGGDQWQYYSFWKDTEVQKVLLNARGRVPIGGTSAGCMVLSHQCFDASQDGVNSEEALSDPYSKYVTLAPGFINVTNINPRVILDTHFLERNRFGRLLTFVSRLSQDVGLPIYGIGIDQHAAFAVSADGRNGTLLGTGHAYVIYGTEKPVRCEPGRALSTRELTVQKIVTGEVFDFMALTGGSPSRRYTVGADDGVLTRNPYDDAPSSDGSSSSSSAGPSSSSSSG